MPLKDNEILSKIVLNKTEEVNKENYLENAEYALYRLQKGEDLEEAKAASIDCKGNTKAPSFIRYWGEEPVSIAYTDATGEALFSRLPFGTYLLYEQKPPVGYKWNNDIGKWETWTIKDVQHTQNNQVIILSEESVSNNSSVTYETVTDAEGNEETVRVVTYHEFFAKHLDERKDGSARLIKQNKDFLGLSDAVFAPYQVNLTNAEIAKILEKTTAELDEMAESDIQKELSKKELSVNDIDINNHFDMKEGKPKTKTETDPDTHEEITKTIDTAIDQNMKTNADASTRGATKTISGLGWGIYYFYEVKAPAGYQADSTPYVFAVDSESVDTLIEVNATDAKTYGEVWLYKQAKEKIGTTDDHLKLFGAQFNLYTSDGNLVKAVPKLRLGGLKTTAQGVVHNADAPDGFGRKEFLVKSFEVKSNTQIEFKIFDGDSSINYTVTVDYETTKDGKITGITIDDTAFTAKYGSNFNQDYTEDDETKNHKDELRLAYYVIFADGTQYYDDTLKKYVDFLEEPTAPKQSSFIDGEGNYDEAGYTAAHEKYLVDLADYVASENLKSCITETYVTADEGGRLNVRGLDWNSYYFHETVPPDGYGLADDVIFTVNAYNCDNQFLPCEGPRATASIIVDKQIPDASYFNAYGEPTFMFKIYGLEKFSEDDTTANRTPDYTTNDTNYKKTGREYTLSIHLSNPNTTGSAMVDVPVGQYLIEEIPVSRYVCTNLELVDGTRDNEEDKFKSVGLTTPTSYVIYHDDTKYDINTTGANQWKAFCDLEGGDKTFGEVVAFHVKYTNEIERYDNFSHVSYADNQIPEREYITAFKPLYSSLIPVYSGTDETYTYEIDLDDAMKNEVFEGVLTYNTGKTVNLTDLSKIQFKTSGNAPVTNVQWDSTTKKLKVTVSEPSASAGSTISLDVGYSDASGFDSYDTTNTSMVRGTLNLTFSEIQAERIKKLTLKNDNNNKSYFPYADTTNTIQDVTSVAVLYAKSEKTVEEEGEEKIVEIFTKSMQNAAYTDTLNTSTGFEFKYWYLLDADGKPVLDKESNVIQFQRNADPAKDEIVQYMFHGTWPAYLKTEADPDNDIEAKNLIPDTFADPASVENVNSFTFQAEVQVAHKRAAINNAQPDSNNVSSGNFRPVVKEVLKQLGGGNGREANIWSIQKLSGGVSEENLLKWKNANKRGFLSKTVLMSVEINGENVKPTIDAVIDYANDTNLKQSNLNANVIDNDYPVPVYAYYDNHTVYWFSADENPMMVGSFKNLFYWNFGNLREVAGLSDWDTSELTSARAMFQRCSSLTSVTLQGTFEKCIDFSNAFDSCTNLGSVTFDEHVNLKSLQTGYYMFTGCTSLTNDELKNIFTRFDFSNNSYLTEEFNAAKITGRSEMLNGNGGNPNNQTQYGKCNYNEIKFFGNNSIRSNLTVTDYKKNTYNLGSSPQSSHTDQVPILQ